MWTAAASTLAERRNGRNEPTPRILGLRVDSSRSNPGQNELKERQGAIQRALHLTLFSILLSCFPAFLLAVPLAHLVFLVHRNPPSSLACLSVPSLLVLAAFFLFLFGGDSRLSWLFTSNSQESGTSPATLSRTRPATRRILAR